MKFKAAVLQKINTPLEVLEISSKPLEYGQVLVKVFYSGVCRSQLMEVRGGRGHDAWLPHLLGHEGAGEVIGTGSGVTKVKPGDKVILGWIKGEGIDAPAARFRSGNQIINAGKVTTFSTHTVVSENRITLKPEGMPMDTAVLFGCAIPTGAGMVFNEIRPLDGATVAVLGLGGIGLSALMALSGFKCSRVIAIDVSREKLALAGALGATNTICAGVDPVYEQVMALAPGGVDICIESAGTIETIELGFSLIRKSGGRLWFASHPPEGGLIRIAPHDLISGKQIFGTWGGQTLPDRDIPLFAEIFRKTNLPLHQLITKRYSLEEVNEALADLEAGIVFRPLLVME
jgi:S-(hydroxymethyl)glutathione dehydrogenase/alcohol dehydrogenase